MQRERRSIGMNLQKVTLFVFATSSTIKLESKFGCFADPVPYTYPASIRIDSKVKCVGATLTSTWILTLCDCVRSSRETPNRVTIRVGIISKEAQIVTAQKILCEDGFISDEKTPDKNLALIKIRPINMGISVRRIALPVLQSQNKTKTVRIKLAKRPNVNAAFSMNGWMHDEKYFTLKTDYEMRTWAWIGKVGSPDKCMSLKLAPQARTAIKQGMFCAEFFHAKAQDCSADRGTLMVQGGMIWGLMNYKHAQCGKYLFYVPYVDITQKSNLDFIMNTVQGRRKYEYEQ